MSNRRLNSHECSGTAIDQNTPLNFQFDGKPYVGFQGDTLASALLANNVCVVGRSFKYHRPRGVWGAWFDDPNAIFNVRLGNIELPNCAGTTTALVDGMQVRSVNAWPSAKYDIKGGLDYFHRWLVGGFYYKTFMWPSWHFFEPSIRKMAGLGHLENSVINDYVSDQIYDQCELLIVGAGAAGLSAARTASEAGTDVLLVDDHPHPGGGLYRLGQDIEGLSLKEWVAEQVLAIKAAGGRILANTTAYGVYDHALVTLAQDNGFGVAPSLWRLRVGRTLLATGATDRPLTFSNNDLPGIMSFDAGAEYLGRYGVLVGSTVALATNNNYSDHFADKLTDYGSRVQRIDLAAGEIKATGRGRLKSVLQGNQSIDCDVLLASSGLSPVLHLWSHAGGKLYWSENCSAFVPGDSPSQSMGVIGSANATFNLEQALDESRTKVLGKSWRANGSTHYVITPVGPETESNGRQWIDYQHDVTLKDIEIAARENFASVEHVKRYTTLGMAVDQGKTSNVSGIAALAAIQGKSIPEIGTTTFRPPFVPVPIELYHGNHRSELVQPLKRLVLEQCHRELNASLGEYGGWLRPAWYDNGSGAESIAREVLMVRNSVGVTDSSPLGKIEIMGPDAEKFINFMFYNTLSTMQPMQIRYGFMLTESGVVFDDGVVTRLSDDRFVISCSSSHVDGVNFNLEAWRQDGNDPDRIFVHDTTMQWSTLGVTGPRARDVLESLNLPLELDKDSFPHMAYRVSEWNNQTIRISRVSFTGDLSYELSIAASQVKNLWEALLSSATGFDGGPVGIEAISVMRAEKGYIIVGKDTDGETMPHDIGFGVPRKKKQSAFVGDRALHTDNANRTNRKQLVGLIVQDGMPPLPTGAHIVSLDAKTRSLGHVTSSYLSPTLNQPIALALMEHGKQSVGTKIHLQHLGELLHAEVADVCAFDPEGIRLNA